MNRKLLTLAVAGALGAPLVASAQSSVQIYGRVHVEANFTKQGTPSRSEDYMGNAGGSNIGFRGTESIGRGLNAWFQCETGLNASTPGATSLCDRNSAVGLRGGFGNVSLGNWDLPMKWATIAGIKHEDTGLFGVAGLMHAGAPTTVGNGIANQTGTTVGATAGAANAGGMSVVSFYRRQQNTVQYWTPAMGGFEARFAVTMSNEEGNNANNAGAGNQNSRTPRTWSFAGKYTNGPMLLTAGYERHNDYVFSGRDDTGWVLAASYTFGGKFRLGFMYEKKEWESLAVANDAEQASWGLFGDIMLGGPHSVQLQYVQARDTKGSFVGTQAAGSGSTLVFNNGAGGTGAKQWGAQYTYAFSKRTNVRARFTVIDNDSNARFGVYSAVPEAPNAGQTARGYGIAIDHRF